MKKKKNNNNENYFDNQLVEKLVLEYQKKNCNDERLLNEIMKHLDKIVIAIINKYHFYDFYEYDDLIQEGRIACIESLPRFDLTKVKQKHKSVFSYFSNVVKRNLRFLTLNKNKKIYKETAVDDFVFINNEISKQQAYITEKEMFNDLIRLLKNVLKDKRRMYNLVVLLEKYVNEVSDVHFKMKDFVAYCKSFGYTAEFVKKFFSIVRNYKDEIMKK